MSLNTSGSEDSVGTAVAVPMGITVAVSTPVPVPVGDGEADADGEKEASAVTSAVNASLGCSGSVSVSSDTVGSGISVAVSLAVGTGMRVGVSVAVGSGVPVERSIRVVHQFVAGDGAAARCTRPIAANRPVRPVEIVQHPRRRERTAAAGRGRGRGSRWRSRGGRRAGECGGRANRRRVRPRRCRGGCARRGRGGGVLAKNHIHPIIRRLVSSVGEQPRRPKAIDSVAGAGFAVGEGVQRRYTLAACKIVQVIDKVALRRMIRGHIHRIGCHRDRCAEGGGLPTAGRLARERHTPQQRAAGRPQVAGVRAGIGRQFVKADAGDLAIDSRLEHHTHVDRRRVAHIAGVRRGGRPKQRTRAWVGGGSKY